MTTGLKESGQENVSDKTGTERMNRIYYKVLHKDDNGGLWSCGGTKHSIEYEVHKIIHAPHKTRLFVFETLEEAEDFISGINRYVIYSCAAPEGIKCRGSSTINEMSRFWFYFNGYLRTEGPQNLCEKISEVVGLAPYDAVLVTKLILLEKVG